MQSFRMYCLKALAPILLMALTACDAQMRNQLDIRTNGFLNDNCFQALIVIEPDESARGLVARRESASHKAKKADLKEMALESLTNYSIDSLKKTGILTGPGKISTWRVTVPGSWTGCGASPEAGKRHSPSTMIQTE